MKNRVLIVDPDPDVLIMFERLLEDEGYTTVTSWSGRDALQVLEQQRFDLLLISDYLPDISAEDLVWEARDRRSAPPYIIMRTRVSEPMGTHQSVLASALDVVCKQSQHEALQVIRQRLCG